MFLNSLQGTMSHMAPEALLRGHISKAADVYSFGITLWELFTGCHAYFGEAHLACVLGGCRLCIMRRQRGKVAPSCGSIHM